MGHQAETTAHVEKKPAVWLDGEVRHLVRSKKRNKGRDQNMTEKSEA